MRLLNPGMGATQSIAPSYGGAAPGSVTGIVHIDFQVTATGSYAISANGKTSDRFSVFVTP
jgi:hypothetical protein